MSMTQEQAERVEQRLINLQSGLNALMGAMVQIHESSANTAESMERMRKAFGVKESN